MRFSGSWCGLFSAGLVGGGLSAWGTWAARNFCRETAENLFLKVINIPSLNVTASLGIGPVLPIHLVNFTMRIEDAYADNPSAMPDTANLAANICTVGTIVPAAIVLALFLAIAGVSIHARNQLQDALGSDVLEDDDDASYRRLPGRQ
jgi:hypothetical protein